MKSTISIITISYNNLEGLQKTFESVFNQTCKDFEYIVIDGGSIDGSKEFIKKNADKISYWVSEPDKGIYDALNKGISKANSEFIVFINSGDSLYNSSVLQTLSEVDSKYDVAYGDTNLIYSDKEIIKNYPKNCNLLFLLNDTIQHQGTRIRRDLLVNHNYSTDYKIVSDWIWFFKSYINKDTFFHIDVVTANFVLDGLSSNNPLLLEEERDRFLINEYPDYFEIKNEIKKLYKENIAFQKKIYSSRWIKFLKKFRLTKI